jgi:hypothetical protein
MFRPDRSSDRGVDLLGWRLRIFAVGAVLGCAGIYLDASWPIYAAIVVLVAGMLIRFVPTRDDEQDPGS